MRTAHLFFGEGGCLLADLVAGHTPIFGVEIDPYHCAVIRERVEQGWFPGFAVHECDISTFDPAPYQGRVDCLCAGWPCQDISVAGSGEGITGDRSGLWSEVVRIAGVLRPRRIHLENSPAIVDRGLGTVLADLAKLGYDARWCVLGSENTGAAHRRMRWWCVAFPAGERCGEDGLGESAGSDPAVADGMRDGLEGELRGGQRRGQLAEAVADAHQTGQQRKQETGLHGRIHDYWRDADGCLRDPPGRGDRAGWASAEGHGAPQPGVLRMADAVAWGMVKARLSGIGNGQDPVTAACAFELLGRG